MLVFKTSMTSTFLSRTTRWKSIASRSQLYFQYSLEQVSRTRPEASGFIANTADYTCFGQQHELLYNIHTLAAHAKEKQMNFFIV